MFQFNCAALPMNRQLAQWFSRAIIGLDVQLVILSLSMRIGIQGEQLSEFEVNTFFEARQEVKTNGTKQKDFGSSYFYCNSIH
jgi:hypothetical protein